jgi:hypothetical protein
MKNKMRQLFSSAPLACWLVYVLRVVTGNFDRTGGDRFERSKVRKFKKLQSQTSRGLRVGKLACCGGVERRGVLRAGGGSQAPRRRPGASRRR